MRIIKVPYSKNIQTIIDNVVSLLAITGITLIIFSIFKLDWEAFLVGVSITIPTSFYLWKVMTFQVFIWTRDFIIIKGIRNLDSSGFTIYGNLKSSRLNWNRVKKVSLDNDCNLLIDQNGGKQIKIDQEFSHWYYLLKNIPKAKLKDSQISDFLEEVFKDLTTCKICGSIAFHKEKCLSCKSVSFNEQMKEEFSDEFEYIKSEQLELFCTEDKFEEVNFYLEEDDGFQLDKNWSPIITKKEVIEYSKKNIWD